MSARQAAKPVLESIPLLCPNHVCRHRRQVLRALHTQRRQYASKSEEDKPFLEKVRRKLWKGEPPGPKDLDDVYGGPGVILPSLSRKQREAAERRETQRFLEEQEGAGIAQRSEAKEQQAAQQFLEEAQADEAAAEAANNAQSIDTVRRNITTKVKEDDSNYQPAATWEGLEILGHEGDWREIPIQPRDEYTPWISSSEKPSWDLEDLTAIMHRAIVECHTCQQLSLNLAQAGALYTSGFLGVEALKAAVVNITGGGKVVNIQGLPMPSEEAKLVLRNPETIRDTEIMTPYTLRDSDFLNARLDPTTPMAFLILKRFSLLSSYRIPDPFLTSLTSRDPSKNTIGALLRTIAKDLEPKPTKVAEKLATSEALSSHSNLLVLGRRETPVDKEKEVGRWKVIEGELKARGLPVLGRFQPQRNV